MSSGVYSSYKKMGGENSFTPDWTHYSYLSRVLKCAKTIFPLSTVEVDELGQKNVVVTLYNLHMPKPYTLDLARSLTRIYRGMYINAYNTSFENKSNF